jgi:hypothetical protein
MMKQRVKATLRVMVGTIVAAILGISYILFTFRGIHADLWAKRWEWFLVLTLFYAFAVPVAWTLIWIHQTGKSDEFSPQTTDPYLIRLDKTRQWTLATIFVTSVLMQIVLEGLYRGIHAEKFHP